IIRFIDRQRPQVQETVAQLKSGGIKYKMITGDAEKTAKAIASRF
ncbi:unnamed protein product, partial [Rotaria sp. Silwood2]